MSILSVFDVRFEVNQACGIRSFQTHEQNQNETVVHKGLPQKPLVPRLEHLSVAGTKWLIATSALPINAASAGAS